MSFLNELKEKRQDAIENVAGIDIDIEATKLTLQNEQERRAFWTKRIAEIDIAIAALEPAPLAPEEPMRVLGQLYHEDEPDDASEFAESGLPEGFTAWAGGECPVDPAAFVSVMFRDGETSHGYVIAGNMNWAHDESCATRIYAYKITEQASAQDETLDQGASEPVVRASPGEVEESRDQSDDEASRAAAIELTADVEPYPEATPLERIPEWNEPQTEGYAPVTDADRYAEALDRTNRATDAEIEKAISAKEARATNPEADALAKAHDWYSPEKVAERQKFNPWGIFGKKLEEVS